MTWIDPDTYGALQTPKRKYGAVLALVRSGIHFKKSDLKITKSSRGRVVAIQIREGTPYPERKPRSH